MKGVQFKPEALIHCAVDVATATTCHQKQYEHLTEEDTEPYKDTGTRTPSWLSPTLMRRKDFTLWK